MAVGGKYSALTTYLVQCGQERVRFTFEELNRIIPLPNHAYQNRPSWANHSKPMSFSSGWLNAGYTVDSVSLTGQWVVFCKTGAVALMDAAPRPHKESTPRPCKEISENTVLEMAQHGYACYDGIAADSNHRYLSWEHCHRAFQQSRSSTNPQDIDTLCLHLAWYLASWGMLRNSFLMQKDYKIHTDVVKLILQPQWEELWDISPEKMAQEQYALLIMLLSEGISDIYISATGETPTDTLLTKILLGTVGCAPAYDRYFKKALSITGVCTQAFSAKSLMALGKLYLQFGSIFDSLQQHCSERIYYPAAKVIDMCLFEYGYQAESAAPTK